jgi:hypothetical protein
MLLRYEQREERNVDDLQCMDIVRGHLSISLLYLVYSLPSSPTLSSPTPLCAYVHPPTPVPIPRVNNYHHQGSMTSISNSRRPLYIKVVINSHLLPPLAPQLHRTSIGYMGTCPHNTTAPSMSHGLMVMRGLKAWCCIGHYMYVLRPSQGSSEHSLWIPPD